MRLIVTSEDDSVTSLVGWLVSRAAQNLCGSDATVKQGVVVHFEIRISLYLRGLTRFPLLFYG
jgi:hypothetical protein